jgi:hypothetical protein
MLLKRRVAALAAVIGALAVVPVASAGAAAMPVAAVPVSGPAVASFGCPVGHRITDPATDCVVHWAIDPPRFHHQYI